MTIHRKKLNQSDSHWFYDKMTTLVPSNEFLKNRGADNRALVVQIRHVSARSTKSYLNARIQLESLKNYKSWGLCFKYGLLCVKIGVVYFAAYSLYLLHTKLILGTSKF